MNKQGEVLAMSLSMRAVGHVLQDNELSQYSKQEDLAYVAVEKGNGDILWRTGDDLPTLDLSSKFNQWTPVKYKGDAAREFRSRISAGEAGILRFGIWKRSILSKIRSTILTIFSLVLLAVLVAVVGSVIVVKQINQPLLELAEKADRISRGDLTGPHAANPAFTSTTSSRRLSTASEYR